MVKPSGCSIARWLALAVAWTAAPSAGAAPLPPKPPDFVADLVAKSFFRALRDGDAQTLASVCDTTFSFDGEAVSGPEVVERLAALRDRVPPVRRVVVLEATDAIARFGGPPDRIASLVVRGAAVAFARTARGGVIALLGRRDDRWKVVGLTD